jgi:thiol-disulfide isomerase/thioredoxin
LAEHDAAGFAQRAVKAPDFDGAAGWLNTAGPLKMSDLKGKIVVLDFWTLCCINCIHVLPDLDKLEKKYPNELVVIGVHTPKFDSEKATKAFARLSFAMRSVIPSSTMPIGAFGQRSAREPGRRLVSSIPKVISFTWIPVKDSTPNSTAKFNG